MMMKNKLQDCKYRSEDDLKKNQHILATLISSDYLRSAMKNIGM